MAEIVLDHVTKKIRGSTVVDDISISFAPGVVSGLKGVNGSGKTMLMRLIAGLIYPTSGEVRIDGKVIGREITFPESIGVLIENPAFLGNYSGYENLEMLSSIRGLVDAARIREVLETVGLSENANKKYKKYSLGMKQRLAIALAVMHEPEVLILDEPINGLDPIGIAEVRSFIRELCDARGKTILISSHILSEISLLADDIGIIDRGVLLEEESLKELEAKNAKFVHFIVSDASKAAQIISKLFQTKNMQIADSYNLYLYDTTLPVAKINRALMENGIDIKEAHLCEDTLEDYFKKITGGEGIA